MPTFNVSGVNLYYELHGPTDRPLLVLNNGLIMNASTSWVYQTKPLSRHYRLLQYDCRGQGQSDHPDEVYTMEGHADDLAALLSGLGVEQAHVAGISYGGEVAQAFALKYPQRTRSLVLIDTVSEVQPQLRIIVENWIGALRAADADAFFNATVPWNFSPRFIQEHPALLQDAKKRYAFLDFPAVTRLCESFLQVDFTSQLAAIKVPTCVIVGELDLLKGIAYAEILQREIAHAELHVLRGAGHASCWERPEEINSVILGFLAKNL